MSSLANAARTVGRLTLNFLLSSTSVGSLSPSLTLVFNIFHDMIKKFVRIGAYCQPPSTSVPFPFSNSIAHASSALSENLIEGTTYYFASEILNSSVKGCDFCHIPA